jgi:hypothetical protein
MRTTLKNVHDLAKSLGFTVDRPAESYVNIRTNQNKTVLYTAMSTGEAWAWLRGHKYGYQTRRFECTCGADGYGHDDDCEAVEENDN